MQNCIYFLYQLKKKNKLHIQAISYDLCLYLAYFTQYDNLQVHSSCCKRHYFILLCDQQYFIKYVYYIFFIHYSVNGHLLPCLDYCKQCCNEHLGACIYLFGSMVFSRCMPRSGIGESCLSSVFLKEPLYYSPQGLYQFTSVPTGQESSFFSTSQAFIC